MARPRVIFDCNVLLQALISGNGASFRCVHLVEDRQITLLLSPAVLTEARHVLTRPFVIAKNAKVTQERVDAFLDGLAYLAEVIRTVPHVQALSRDPKDEHYLDLALAGRADFLVTRDRDLLELPQDHSEDAKQFRQGARNQIQIVSPTAFLSELDA
jgi:putative PIN family toxin of toxin-antitoxin system